MNVSIDFERIFRGLSDLWDGLTNFRWPAVFFRDALGITNQGALDLIPKLLILYILLYAVFLVSALTLRFVQGQKSIFQWKTKLPIALLSLLAFLVWPVLCSVVQQTGRAIGGVQGTFALNLSGIYYVFDVIGAIWLNVLVIGGLAWLLYYPLSKMWKCFTSYKEKPLVGVIWTVFDVGLGLVCASAVLLGMFIGKWQLYLLVPLAILLNHFGEKKQGDPPKKKTAEIYSTTP